MSDGEDVPRLSAVVERQRRELAQGRADGEAAVVVATARGVLMERHGLSLAEAARQLADMAAAAGLPQLEMAAAVLAEEAPPPPAQAQPDVCPEIDTVAETEVNELTVAITLDLDRYAPAAEA